MMAAFNWSVITGKDILIFAALIMLIILCRNQTKNELLQPLTKDDLKPLRKAVEELDDMVNGKKP